MTFHQANILTTVVFNSLGSLSECLNLKREEKNSLLESLKSPEKCPSFVYPGEWELSRTQWEDVLQSGLQNNGSLVGIHISGPNHHMEKDIFRNLLNLLPSVAMLRSLVLDNMCIGDELLAKLSKDLTTMPCLASLSLQHNFITARGLKALTEALIGTLTQETTEDGGRSEYMSILDPAETARGVVSLMSLNLSYNRIGDRGVDSILALSSGCVSTLTDLVFFDCNLGDHGCYRIVTAARHNPQLYVFGLGLGRRDLWNVDQKISSPELQWRLDVCKELFQNHGGSQSLRLVSFGGPWLNRHELLHLEEVRLSSVCLTDIEVYALSFLLEQDAAASVLDLSGNRISSFGLMTMLKVISRSCSLQHFDFSDNLPMNEDEAFEVGNFLRQHCKSLLSFAVGDVLIPVQDYVGRSSNVSLNAGGNVDPGSQEDELLSGLLQENFVIEEINGIQTCLPVSGQVHFRERLDLAHQPHMRSHELTAIFNASVRNEHLNIIDLTCTWVRYSSCNALLQVAMKHCQLSTLTLEHCGLDDTRASLVASLLETQQSITHLNLGWNCIRDDGALLLAHGLRKNRTLSALDLRFNEITKTGLEEVAKVLADSHNSSLQSLNLRGNILNLSTLKTVARICAESSNLVELDFGEHSIASSLDPYQRENAQQWLRSYVNQSTCDSKKQNLVRQVARKRRAFLKRFSFSGKIPEVDRLSTRPLDTLCYPFLRGILFPLHGTSLVFLSLAANGLQALHAEGLSEDLKSAVSLAHMDLSFNNLGPDGAAWIFKGIDGHPSLKELNLSANALATKGVAHFCDYLSRQQSLVDVNLSSNNICERGIAAVKQAVRSQSSKIRFIDLRHNKSRYKLDSDNASQDALIEILV